MSALPSAWSYSSLKKFKTCAKQYYEVKVAKNYKEPDSTAATMYGKEFHTAAEFYVQDGTPLPEHFKYSKPHLDVLRSIPGDKLCEHKMALTEKLEPCDFFAPDAWCRGVADLLIINKDTGIARCVDYKGLAVDTPIPTPNGFVTMGELAVGDMVYGTDGLPYPVTGKSEVKHLPCFEVRMTNGASVVCDAEHLWGLLNGDVVNVQSLQKRDKIPLTKPVQYREESLPIDPYVLGFWLADGTAASGAATKGDQFIWDEVVRRGYELGVDTNGGKSSCETRTIKGIRGLLNSLGVLGNKHIPDKYKLSSYSQRVDLVRGLMDGDGYANPTRKQAVFNIVSKVLSDDLREVIESLGVRCLQSKTKYSGFGVTGVAWPLFFRPISFNPFLLPRKAAAAESFFGGREYLEVGGVVSVPSVPTQCISVGSPNSMYLCTKHYIPTHNTGKSAKYADPAQLELMALMIFKHFPFIRVVKGGLLFVVANEFKKSSYDVSQEHTYWRTWMQDVHRLSVAHSTGVWNPTKSGLCRKHCVVTDCQHNGANT